MTTPLTRVLDAQRSVASQLRGRLHHLLLEAQGAEAEFREAADPLGGGPWDAIATNIGTAIVPTLEADLQGLDQRLGIGGRQKGMR